MPVSEVWAWIWAILGLLKPILGQFGGGVGVNLSLVWGSGSDLGRGGGGF